MEEQARNQENKYEKALKDLKTENIRVEITGFEDQYISVATLMTKDVLEPIEELVKRATPMKPINDYFGGYKCPNCGEYKLVCSFENYGYCDTRLDYCPECGQAIDWSDK